jgi:putative Holliday junction resolvase
VFSKRIIGVDYGRKRIGLACSDPLRITAQPLATLVLRAPVEAAKKVSEVLAQHEVELVVIGLPVSLSGGSSGKMADEIRKFAKRLEGLGYQITFEDERFTSAEAIAAMRLSGKTEKQMRGKIDSIAAQLILQDYLDTLPK